MSIVDRKNIEMERKIKRFFDSVTSGNDRTVSELLREGINPNCLLGRDKTSALYLAAGQGDLVIVDSLLDSGCDIDLGQPSTKTTPFLIACKHGCFYVAQTLQERGCGVSRRDNEGRTALHLAAIGGHFDIVKWLLKERHTDINIQDRYGNTSFSLAVENNKIRVIGILIKFNADLVQWNKEGQTPLWKACQKGFVDVGKILIHEILINGEKIHLDDADHLHQRTPLYVAVQACNQELVQLLVNAGDTPLLKAITLGHLGIVDTLLSAKRCDLHLPFPGSSTNPIHWAVYCDSKTANEWHFVSEDTLPVMHLSIVQRLIDKGVDINASSNDLCTPLHIACFHGNLAVVKILTAKQCSINQASRQCIPRSNGWNFYMKPIDVALVNGHEEVVKFLVSLGAKYSLKDWLDVPQVNAILQEKPGIMSLLQTLRPGNI